MLLLQLHGFDITSMNDRTTELKRICVKLYQAPLLSQKAHQESTEAGVEAAT